MRKTASMFILLLFTGIVALAQSKVSGTVKDQNGDPVPFATVNLKGSKITVAADANANFTISAKSGDILVVSAVGIDSTEITVGNDPVITVTVNRSSGSITDVVVTTALGIKRNRNTLPYAAQTISGSDVSNNRSFDIAQSMSGKIAGLQISQSNTLGGSTNAILRGYKSITGDNQALFVIDGTPVNNNNTNSSSQQAGGGGYDYGSPISDLNPDDIASITVLKSAAATALYGSRASNGVILITTKKGSDNLSVTLNIGVQKSYIDKSTFPKYQNEYGAGYGPFYDDGTGFAPWFYGYTGEQGLGPLVPTTEDASYGAAFDPTLMVYQWDALDPTSPYYQTERPWVAAQNGPVTFFNKPWSNSQSILVTNSSAHGSYKFGYTRDDEDGILPNSNQKKNIVNFGASYNILKNLTIGAEANYYDIPAIGRYETGYSPSSGPNPMNNFRQWWQTNVDVQEQKEAYFRTLENITWNWSDPYEKSAPIYWDNLYFSRYQNYESDNRKRLIGNINARWDATNWLSFTARVSLDQYHWLQEERTNMGSVETSGYSKFLEDFYERNIDLMANFHKELGSSFNLNALVGANLRHSEDQSTSASTNGGLALPDIWALSNSAATPDAPSEYYGIKEVNGIYGSATLSYKDFLTLDASLRRDASSTLPKGNNAYYYPSASLGFVFSKLLKNTPWLSYGKLSVNAAEVGSDAPIYSVYDTYSILTPYSGNPVGSASTNKNNPNLRPERTKSGEIDLEMAFLQNRLGFTASYYNSKTIDNILPVTVSSATGYASEYQNAGSMTNKGVEITLRGTPVQTKNIQWDITVNWSENRNKVVKLFTDGSGNEAKNLQLAAFPFGQTLNAPLGQPYGQIRGSDFVYTNGQRTVDADGYYELANDGDVNENIGTIQPKWIGGINNSLRVKDFTLSFLVDFKQGGNVFSLDQDFGQYDGLYPITAGLNANGKPKRSALEDGGGVILPGVTEDGKTNSTYIEADYAGAAYGFGAAPDKAFVYDASYIKLREVILSYSFPHNLMERIKAIKGIQLSLIGHNLWIIHKNLPYADPEAGTSFGNISGFQSGSYPAVRNFSLNMKVNF
ncbi:SusC/RagA family TonB-linked outer membrane protein [Parafilimonas sp.]|uniref:SusC/RagA family TonB-linked outer membrane protein n=1 Tax=Parafilimonas sp. TaxID=1969739 RepID=UPI0039E3C2DC